MKAPSKCSCTHHAPPTEWKTRLRKQAGRVTPARENVLKALEHLRRPSTPREIADATAHHGCDLATVYRSMALFEEMGLVQRVDLGDGLARFEIADPAAHGHHHHHLICRHCHAIVELDNCILDDVERRLAQKHGFDGVSHRLEFFGTCPRCQD